MNVYRWMYTHLTPWIKRPWTYFTRDVRQKYPLPWQLGLSGIMLLIGHYCWGEALMWVCVGITFGILVGHFWWGSKYIPGQTE